MSGEDDVELKELLTQTLESNGSLAKIKSQLRASAFLALTEDEELQKRQPLLNNRIKSCLETSDGRVMFCVVKEFLEFFGLEFTMSVFDAESYLGKRYCYDGKEQICDTLGVPLSDTPILLHLIKSALMNVKNASSFNEKQIKELNASDKSHPTGSDEKYENDTFTDKPMIDFENSIITQLPNSKLMNAQFDKPVKSIIDETIVEVHDFSSPHQTDLMNHNIRDYLSPSLSKEPHMEISHDSDLKICDITYVKDSDFTNDCDADDRYSTTSDESNTSTSNATN